MGVSPEDALVHYSFRHRHVLLHLRPHISLHILRFQVNSYGVPRGNCSAIPCTQVDGCGLPHCAPASNAANGKWARRVVATTEVVITIPGNGAYPILKFEAHTANVVMPSG